MAALDSKLGTALKKKQNKLPDRKFSVTASGVGAILVFLIITSYWIFGDEVPETGGALFTPIAAVERAPFDIFVTEAATLDAKQSVILSSELPSNRAKILYLVPEGDLIEAGEVVARFDPTSFEEDIQKIENDLKEEQANLLQAQAELKLQQSDSRDRASKLEYQIEVAKLKLQSLKEGRLPTRVAVAKKEVQRAKAEFNSAKQARTTEQALFAKGLTKERSLQEATDNEQEKQSAYRIAAQSLKMLQTVTLPAELKQAELQVENKQREYDLYVQTLAQKQQKQNAVVARITNKIEVLHQNLARTRGYLKKTELAAPVSGLVLYKTITVQNEKRKVQVGDSLWNRHGFAVIPDMSSMVAFANVRENELGRLALGQRATIRPEAYSELLLKGVVESIGTLASGGNEDGGNYFRVRIALHESDPRLRPGMTARASILTRRFDDALLIPVEAVFYDNQQPVCFLWRDGNPQRVAVELGASDGDQVVITAGLQEDQAVMLVYPGHFES